MALRKLKRIPPILRALRHVPPRVIALRLRREFRQKRLVKPGTAEAIAATLPVADAQAVATVLAGPDFQAYASATRALTESAFTYDPAAEVLQFRHSGDTASLGDIDSVAWTVPGGIPVSDVNRCFFMSFVEQASLLESEPLADLQRLDAYVERLGKAAPLGVGYLPIPWHSLSVARRLLNLVAGLAVILGRDPSLASRPEMTRLLARIVFLRRIVAEIREDDLGYNHLASEIFAECVAARLFRDDAALAGHAREFVATMQAQIGSDGMQLERSATYQAHMLGHLDVLIAGRILPSAEHETIVRLAEKMRYALALMTHRDGGVAVFNDAAIGDGPSPASLGVTAHSWAAGIHHLTQAGYARLEQGPFSVIFDAGPCGEDNNPGHAHADFLSFELDLGADRLFVDPGVTTYKAGRERDLCRSAAAHNGPAFLGIEPIEFIGPFRVGRRGRARFFDGVAEKALADIAPGIGGTQSGFEHFGGRVARWLAPFGGDALLVVDAWQGCAGRAAGSHFLVDARNWSVAIAGEGDLEVTHRTTGERLRLSALAGKLRLEDAAATFFPYGPRLPVAGVRFVLEPDTQAGEARLAALLIAPGDEDKAKASALAVRLAPALLSGLKT